MHDVPPAEIKRITDVIRGDYPSLPGDLLARHLAEVVRWNRRAGLVARQNTTMILERLVKQSAGLYELVASHLATPGQAQRVVDVGSGGGFPGLVWAILRPDWDVLLVERKQKKAAFLERTRRLLGLERVAVYAGDALDAVTAEDVSSRFDVAATMAVGPPARTAALIEGFLRENGIFATTVSRDDPGPPDTVGDALVLLKKHADGGSVFALYRKEPART